MTRWDLTTLEQQIRDLQDLADKLKAVNTEQQRIIGDKNAHIAFLEDQLRRAQEKLRTCRAQALEDAAKLADRGSAAIRARNNGDVSEYAAGCLTGLAEVIRERRDTPND